MLRLLKKIFSNIFFPKFCLGCSSWGQYLCKECFAKMRRIVVSICPYCGKKTTNNYTHPLCGALSVRLDGLMSLYYYTKPLPKMLRALKYERVTETSSEFSKIISPSITNQIRDFAGDKCLVVPIPLHLSRERDRGFNQANIFARILSEKTKLTTASDILKRVRATKPQAKTKSRAERLTNLDRAFEIVKGKESLIKGAQILLVDDVWTTGTTMKETCRTLKEAGAIRVLALTIAH